MRCPVFLRPRNLLQLLPDVCLRDEARWFTNLASKLGATGGRSGQMFAQAGGSGKLSMTDKAKCAITLSAICHLPYALLDKASFKAVPLTCLVMCAIRCGEHQFIAADPIPGGVATPEPKDERVRVASTTGAVGTVKVCPLIMHALGQVRLQSV